MRVLLEINQLLWGGPVLILLMGLHLYHTFHLRFIQRRIIRGIHLSLGEDADSPSHGFSRFGSLTTTLAATLGTGNIVGVSTAVFLVLCSGAGSQVYLGWQPPMPKLTFAANTVILTKMAGCRVGLCTCCRIFSNDVLSPSYMLPLCVPQPFLLAALPRVMPLPIPVPKSSASPHP